MSQPAPIAPDTTKVTGPRRVPSRAALRYVLRRLGQAVLVMLLVVVGSFFLIKLAPGDFVDTLAGTSELTIEIDTDATTRIAVTGQRRRMTSSTGA